MVQVVGHDDNRIRLKNVIASRNIANAYLFDGKEGIGKKLVAIEFANSILCDDNSSGIFCDKCKACLTFNSNSDFKIVSPIKDVIKVDMIRELVDELFLKPTISKRKVFIIDDADKMNEQAQNALLKALEEPPLYATIILVVTSKEKLLNTIKSRTVEFCFDKLTDDEIVRILRNINPNVNKELLEIAVNFSNGSAMKAMEVISDNNFEIENEIAETILKKNFLEMNKKFEMLKNDKNLKSDIQFILEKVMYIFYNKLKSYKSFDYRLIDLLECTIENIKKNANVDLALDSMMIRILEL